MSDHPHELSVTRYIAAPPSVVWRVWTERTSEFWCPKPWRAEIVEIDLRPGGRCAMVMKGPDGEEMPSDGVFLEVIPERLAVSTDAYRAGWIPAEPFMTGIFAFEPKGEGTRYTGTPRHWSAEAMQSHKDMGFEQGWGIVADQLAELAEAAIATD